MSKAFRFSKSLIATEVHSLYQDRFSSNDDSNVTMDFEGVMECTDTSDINNYSGFSVK